ncbi:hypothetical protein GALMADRAFT_241055 [Galerina marginata CBS 339.88]|uniref:Uncharacterized protein n=1 Tax=Galerina marginata (strain CBS 339.88) TaxID=685588 RepID=A0A067TL78_GALM3|nr:hypothetical protein GALMADRAFT_241055 [Galerina marginata CBS 339.88]
MTSYIVRDPRFSMSMVDAEVPSTIHYSRASYAKQLERRIVRLWKLVTRTTRKQPRSSFISPDFIVITSRKSLRRSTIHPQLYRFKQ